MLDLQNEAFGKAAKMADNFWIINTRHRPGLSKHMFEIGNRTLVFKLGDKTTGEPALVAINATEPAQAFAPMHDIEKRTGLKLKYIVSPGGGHLIHLAPWHAEFPEAKILVPPTRLPRTRTGSKLMALPRVEKMDLHDPLPQFKGELDAVLFHGLLGIKDIPAAGEGGSDSPLTGLRVMMHVMFNVKDPIDELWIYHKASKTIVGGENLGWFYPKAELDKQPFMLRKMVKPDKLYIQTMARKVAHRDIVKKCWHKILLWPADTVMTYHELPGIAYIGDGRDALLQAAREVKQF